MDIAVIGTGVMGHGIAVNLLRGGHRVSVWNRTPERAAGLVAGGAIAAGTPAAAAAAARLVIEVTADDASSRQVWTGEAGILAGCRRDAVLLTSATLSPGWVDELASACRGRDLTFLDAPVTGGRAGAESGTLTFLVGGDAERLTPVRPALDCVSRQVLHFGPVGSGTRYKLVLNMLQAVHLHAFGEAMRLARDCGLDEELVGPALAQRLQGPITEAAWTAWRTPRPPVAFATDLAVKDLTYAQRMAGELPTPLLRQVLADFRALAAQGRGGEDWTAVLGRPDRDAVRA